jgi:hypothetical protein
MPIINESLSHLNNLLLDPLEQKPSVKLRLDALLREFNNFSNEATNANQAWSTTDFQLTPSATGDTLVSKQNVGKIWFVTTSTYAVDFTDLQDAATDWWYYEPYMFARPEDYNGSYLTQIAFYRKNGSLYAKVPAQYSGESLTVTASTGSFAQDATLETRAAMGEYHHLPEIRAAMNLLPAVEWSENAERDDFKRRNLYASLMAQERRVYDQFVVAKRSLTAEDIVYRGDNDFYFDTIL